MDQADWNGWVIGMILASLMFILFVYITWLILGPYVGVPVGLIVFYGAAKLIKNSYDDAKTRP